MHSFRQKEKNCHVSFIQMSAKRTPLGCIKKMPMTYQRLDRECGIEISPRDYMY